LKEEKIIDTLDALISLPRRDILVKIIKSTEPITTLEISHSLNISMSEALDHVYVLHKLGLITKSKREGRTIWSFYKPMDLHVNISNNGITFKYVKPGLLLKIFKKLNWL
jgi:predicted transcriptional regulator